MLSLGFPGGNFATMMAIISMKVPIAAAPPMKAVFLPILPTTKS